ncbi:MAG: phage integrase N-terminal SAM-like domain-containing protein [Clostridia bacterium]|nr:phage integrase N-terminal SAM-like domain-containing protein [Clostridia bacterium]
MARIKMAVQKQEVKTLSQCFEDFIKHCKRKNLSEATIKSYRHHLAKFFQYFGDDTDIMLLIQNTIYDYVSHLLEVLDNPTTINTGLKHLKAFAKSLNE